LGSTPASTASSRERSHGGRAGRAPARAVAVALPYALGCALSCALAPLAGCGAAVPADVDPEAVPVDAYPLDHGRRSSGGPDPAFGAPRASAPTAAPSVVRRALRADGEIIVLEGDDRFLTAGGDGYGLTQDNLVAVAREVLAQYPDVFDTIQLHTTFPDRANGGAYYQGIANDVAGLGRDVFDGRPGWGLASGAGRLSGFVNMNSLETFGGLEQAGIARSSFHAVIAQELTHRWLFFMAFRGSNGMASDRLLGRDEAHWSRLAQANGSVQDGNRWRQLDERTFLLEGNDDDLAPLDLYGMGIYRADQVPPLYYLDEATLDGMPLTSTSRIPRGARVQGRKIDVTIEQVVAALGPRNPPAGTEDPYYRVALVLLTAPGQSEAEIAPYLRAVKQVGETFPETYKSWTRGAGAICMRTSARCPEPRIGLDRAGLLDDDDGTLGPGDAGRLAVRVRNDGLGTAEGVQVTVRSLTDGVTVRSATVTAPAIAEGAAVDVGAAFDVAIGAEVPCASLASFEVMSTTREGPRFRARFELAIGQRVLRVDDLEDVPGWRVDPASNDTATAGRWGIGAPEFVSVLGVVTQPAQDHTPGLGKLAFVTGPAKGATFGTHDVDGGATTLESPIFPLEGATAPSLSFYAWFVARDFAAAGGPTAVPGAALEVLGSSDGGANYVPLRTIDVDTTPWTRVTIPLAGALPITNRMRFRYVARDASASGVTEAAIDDLELTELVPQCAPKQPSPSPTAPPDAGGCANTSGHGGLALLGAAGLAALGARRRRR
jgi:hypothetical protein